MKVTLREIAEKTGLSWHGIRARKIREGWQACGVRVVNHKPAEEFETEDLHDDLKALFPNPGIENEADGEAATPSATSTPSVSFSERGQFVAAPAQLAPVQNSTAREQQPLPLPGAAAGFAQLTTGELVSTETSGHTRPASASTARSNSLPDSVSELKQWQRDVMTARLVVLGAVESISTAECLSIGRAIDRFLDRLCGGMIDPEITKMAEIANHRRGNKRSLTKSTVYYWIRARKNDGNLGLAPADKESKQAPSWSREFLELHRLPSKPTVPMVLEKMGDRAPSYGKALRFLKKFSRLDAQRGRMSGSELRSIRGYTRRGKENLMPLDVVVADGHSFKAKCGHPVHGRPFHPEMEAIIDVSTRVCIGWSIGLAESSHVVADALRHAVTVNDKKPFGGVPAIFYADQGAGNTAKAVSHIELGVLARIGSQFRTGIAGNPQGRGVIEKLQNSLWIRAAKELLTFTGKDMDTLALRRVMKIVNKDIKAKGTSALLITWSRFLHFAAEQVEAYNNRPHSAHPKIADMRTGLRRNMTPAEMWQSFVADGWQPTLLSIDEINDLFRPMVRVRCRRAQVTVFGNIYYHKTLEHYQDEEVLVNYDIHDAKIVWVRDLEQRLICEAVWDANKRDYFPVPVIEQARQKRMEGRLKRLEDQAYEVRQERRGVINGAPAGDNSELLGLIAPEEPATRLKLTLFESDLENEEKLAKFNSDVADVARQPERDLDMTEHEEYDINDLPEHETNDHSDPQEKPELDCANAVETNEERSIKIISLQNNSENEAVLRTGTDNLPQLRPRKWSMAKVSRVNNLVHESLEDPGKAFRAGLLTVNSGRQIVKVDGVEINCRPQEYQLLFLLIRNRGRVFSNEDLLQVLSQRTKYDGTLRACVCRLNKSLVSAGAKEYIKNKPKQGYYFAEMD